MKVLYGYPAIEGYNNRTGLTDARLAHIERLKLAGFNVKPFNMSYTKKLPILQFKQMDILWKHKDKYLMTLYKRFLHEIEDCDVFYNSVGINFHPDFISKVNITTVFGFNDDPESSEVQSRPVAQSYDMCAIGNIAEIGTYQSWGVSNVFWQPMGFSPDMYDFSLTYESIMNDDRDVDLFMIIDKLSRYRRDRMNKVDKAFPHAHFYGRGWSRGYLKQGLELNYLQRTKIGLNIHNSTGPINTRLYYLPANGVMQICDNKSHLGDVFKLDEEVIGFDSIEEGIELAHYYLKNEHERRTIAAKGWMKSIKCYNEVAVFDSFLKNVDCHSKNKFKKDNNVSLDKELDGLSTSFFYRNYFENSRHFKIKASKIYRKIRKG